MKNNYLNKSLFSFVTGFTADPPRLDGTEIPISMYLYFEK